MQRQKTLLVEYKQKNKVSNYFKELLVFVMFIHRRL